MISTTSRRRALWLAGLACAIPWPSRAEPPNAGWAPALAAWGDSVESARSDERADAEALAEAPVLVPVSEDASAAAVEPADAGELRANEFPPARDETQRWVPGFAFHSGILGQRAEGSVDSPSSLTYNYIMRQQGTTPSSRQPTPPATQCPRINGQLIPEPSQVIVSRPLNQGFNAFGSGLTLVNQPCAHFTGVDPTAEVLPAGNDDLFLSPEVGASVEVMTPGLQGLPGRPRLFAHGGASLAFAFDRDVAKEGVPNGVGTIEPPSNPSLNPPLPPGSEGVLLFPQNPLVSEAAIIGQGSKTSGEVNTLIASAGVGVAFTVDALERRLRIRPSIEWMRQEIDVTGRVVRVYRADTGLNIAGLPQVNSVMLAPIDMDAEKARHFYGLGPGLEVEMDAARAGPLMLSLFASGQAYRMLGDTEVQMRASQDVEADGTYVLTDQTVEAEWSFHVHDWAYRGGVGLRFRWLPED
jgi:hypothetical protein